MRPYHLGFPWMYPTKKYTLLWKEQRGEVSRYSLWNKAYFVCSPNTHSVPTLFHYCHLSLSVCLSVTERLLERNHQTFLPWSSVALAPGGRGVGWLTRLTISLLPPHTLLIQLPESLESSLQRLSLCSVRHSLSYALQHKNFSATHVYCGWLFCLLIQIMITLIFSV